MVTFCVSSGYILVKYEQKFSSNFLVNLTKTLLNYNFFILWKIFEFLVIDLRKYKKRTKNYWRQRLEKFKSIWLGNLWRKPQFQLFLRASFVFTWFWWSRDAKSLFCFYAPYLFSFGRRDHVMQNQLFLHSQFITRLGFLFPIVRFHHLTQYQLFQVIGAGGFF